MVCAEAILANRPLIASAVCPALEDLQEASIEVQPDNIDQYCQAVLRLSEEPSSTPMNRRRVRPSRTLL